MARILVVDDQPTIHKIVGAVLARGGHVMVTAIDGYDAMEKLKQKAVDLVITDATMPGINGYLLVKTLRADPATAQVPILLLTGKNERRDVDRAIEAGVDEYLMKPVVPDLLTKKIQTLLTKTSAHEVREAGEFVLTFSLTELSVDKVTLETSVAFALGTKLSLRSQTFQGLKINLPTMEVTACDPIPSGHRIRGRLMGLSQADREKIASHLETLIRHAA